MRWARRGKSREKDKTIRPSQGRSLSEEASGRDGEIEASAKREKRQSVERGGEGSKVREDGWAVGLKTKLSSRRGK